MMFWTGPYLDILPGAVEIEAQLTRLTIALAVVIAEFGPEQLLQ